MWPGAEESSQCTVYLRGVDLGVRPDSRSVSAFPDEANSEYVRRHAGTISGDRYLWDDGGLNLAVAAMRQVMQDFG